MIKQNKTRKTIIIAFAIVFQLSLSKTGLTQSETIAYVSKTKTQDVLILTMNSQLFLFPANKDSLYIQKKSIWKGAGIGFGIGGGFGFIFGIRGTWVINNKAVPPFQHGIVDMFIFGTPAVIIGSIISSRKPTTSLTQSKLHIALGGGLSSLNVYSNMLDAFNTSEFEGSTLHWFGYLHYPNGKNISIPYTWNFTIDYNITQHISTGFSYNKFAKQQVEGKDNQEEYGKGSSYGLFADYIFNPINPQTRSRLEFAAGAGISYHYMIVGGTLDSLSPGFKIKESKLLPHLRFTIDYYSRKQLSLQFKTAWKFNQPIEIPEQSNGNKTLVSHAVNFKSFDFTLGIRYHIKL